MKTGGRVLIVLFWFVGVALRSRAHTVARLFCSLCRVLRECLSSSG